MNLDDTINYLYGHGDRGDLSQTNQPDGVVSRDEFNDLYQNQAIRPMIEGTATLESFGAYRKLRNIRFGRIGGRSTTAENRQVRADFFRGLLERRMEHGIHRLESRLHRTPLPTLRRYARDLNAVLNSSDNSEQDCTSRSMIGAIAEPIYSGPQKLDTKCPPN